MLNKWGKLPDKIDVETLSRYNFNPATNLVGDFCNRHDGAIYIVARHREKYSYNHYIYSLIKINLQNRGAIDWQICLPGCLDASLFLDEKKNNNFNNLNHKLILGMAHESGVYTVYCVSTRDGAIAWKSVITNDTSARSSYIIPNPSNNNDYLIYLRHNLSTLATTTPTTTPPTTTKQHHHLQQQQQTVYSIAKTGGKAKQILFEEKEEIEASVKENAEKSKNHDQDDSTWPYLYLYMLLTYLRTFLF